MGNIRNPSLPKERIKILLLENISDNAVNALNAAGYGNIERVGKALTGPALASALADVRMLGIRSRSEITAEVVAATDKLIAIGCFSVGTNQVDLDAARRKGIPVFNAPFSNTRSVAELTIAEIVMLYRRIFPRSVSAHSGGWDKSASGSREVRGKTLGIVGYGNIGSQLSDLAEAMGMRVIFYDHTDKLRRGNVEPTLTLDELLATADIVSVHLPETPATIGMFGAREISHMKQGAYFINNARGTLVDLEALAAALKCGHLGGAAVDVFRVEPSSNADRFTTPLQGLDNVICPPTSAARPRRAGAHRCRGCAQVRRIFRRRLDGRRRQLSPGAVADAAGRHALHPGAAEPAGRAWPAQRRIRQAPRQYRRAVLPDRRRHRLRRARR